MKTNLDANIIQSENVIIADADYIDKVAFDLIVNFERMIGRRIHEADMARWLDWIALDGGSREGESQTQVILIHDKKNVGLDNFVPSNLKHELNGKAFRDNLGEFVITTLPIEDMVSREDFFVDILRVATLQTSVKRIMIVPDTETYYNNVVHALRNVDDSKRMTVFSMQPMPGGNLRQEILGYSLMNALGISADEIKP